MRASYLRVACLLLGAAAIGLAAQHVDWSAARQSLRALGLRAPLVVLPYLVSVVCDTLGWRASFEHARAIRPMLLFRIRVATDATVNSLPGGAALGEALRIVLLKRCFGLEVTEGIANLAISKLSVAVAQAAFLVLGIALATADLSNHSMDWIGRPGLERVALFGALLLLLALVALALAIPSGVLVWLLHRLRSVAKGAWRERLHRLEAPLARIDHGLAVARRIPGFQVLASVAYFFVGYLALALEDWLILRLIDVDVSFARALSMTALISVVRVAFFFIPSGLGAQELGYYGLLKAYGVPHVEVAAAVFLLVKRCKDVLFIVLGYGLLAGLPARITEVRPSRHPPRPER